MPANSISPYGTDSGPGTRMDKDDHMKTASYAYTKESIAYRKEQEKLIQQGKFKEAQDMDIKDLRDKFGTKYDKGIAEMETYTDDLLTRRPADKEIEKQKKREEKKKKITINNL